MLPQDPLRERLLPILEQCPLQAGPLLMAYKDLALAVEWQDLRVLVLPNTEWAIITGHRRMDDALRAVLPLPLHTTSLLPSSLRSIFTSLSALRLSDLPAPDAPLVPSIDELKAAYGRAPVPVPVPASAIGGAAAEVTIVEESAAEVEGGAVPQHEPAIDTDTLYMAIATTDSTVVYYKLARGIRKPADIPDE